MKYQFLSKSLRVLSLCEASSQKKPEIISDFHFVTACYSCLILMPIQMLVVETHFDSSLSAAQKSEHVTLRNLL